DACDETAIFSRCQISFRQSQKRQEPISGLSAWHSADPSRSSGVAGALTPGCRFQLNNFSVRLDSWRVKEWNPMIVWLLLGLLGLALGSGAMMVLLIRHWRRNHAFFESEPTDNLPGFLAPRTAFIAQRPASWLVIRSRSLQDVQSALGLNNPRPCTWTKGLAMEQKLFIGPPVNGWILIVGSGLPDPGDDVDACFRFLLDLSRKLGQVQFFGANRVLGHHAWVRVEAGRVVRAYAWAGRTVWNQGIKTRAELELGLKCFHYFEG